MKTALDETAKVVWATQVRVPSTQYPVPSTQYPDLTTLIT